MENYVKYRLVGGKLILHKGVLPHKFECQKVPTEKKDRPGFKQRQVKSKPVQVNIEKMKTKSTNMPKNMNKKKVTCLQETNYSESFTDSSVATTSSFISAAAEMSTDLATTVNMNENLFKEYMQKGALMAMSRDLILCSDVIFALTVHLFSTL